MHFFGNLIFNIAYVIFSEFSTKSFFFLFDFINNLDVGYATVLPIIHMLLNSTHLYHNL